MTVRSSLNKAWLKVKPVRQNIDRFKTALIHLLDGCQDAESEEFHKNLLSDFFKNNGFHPAHSINTKDRKDLVIHNGKDAKSSVGVIIETKKPGKQAEMLRPDDLNRKALHELMLYFLRERITGKNLEIKHLVACNVHEWFVFDAMTFDRLFAQDKKLVKQFTDFEEGRLSDTSTDYFYKQIAQPFVAKLKEELPFTYFDFREYERVLRNADKADDQKLIALYKFLSPEHLLKLPFANDSNSLDKGFYNELLHIIGLTEVKDKGKKLIQRKANGQRNPGSLLELAIVQLDSHDKISRLQRPSDYGATQDERLFGAGLELVITWMNRILFLKLLEAQLLSYHKGEKGFGFLSLEKIKDFDALDKLFFRVLAKLPSERDAQVREAFSKVPYLNSSLFEPTELEHQALFVNGLEDFVPLTLHPQTVLKDNRGKRLEKLGGSLNTLEYLFSFLDAYDFSSEGGEDIQEENKTLINASVLGLIFEKLNGYKDGSFFTPGFVTMYMCGETIRKAVLQKFKDAKGWECADMNELYNQIKDKKEANQIINSIKICDPAVGSGHFLVSALNELIAVKHELEVLIDSSGRILRDYQIDISNDELVVTDTDDGHLFEYRVTHSKNDIGYIISDERQRLQETLFKEKQTIIENCLFGVDVNPNSVKICRLRLWIELLKNAYYKKDGHYTELETLPNIDINIKCGNSLISRFALDADLKQALRKSKWNIGSYKNAVQSYRRAVNKEEKREMVRLIEEIKSGFRAEIGQNDPKVRRMQKLSEELFNRFKGHFLFEPEVPYNESQEDFNKKRNAEQQKLEKEIDQLKAEIDGIKRNAIFDNAFEWRFEYPEVLDEDGAFKGFDVVLGNPPYIRQEEISWMKPQLQQNFGVFAGTADLYVYFVELGMKLLKPGGHFGFIIPNKWMRAGYGKSLRGFISSQKVEGLLDFGDLPVFEEATTYPCILTMTKAAPSDSFPVANLDTLDFEHGMRHYLKEISFQMPLAQLSPEGWTLSNVAIHNLLQKIKEKGIPLGEYVNGQIYYGIKTGYNEAFVIDLSTKNRLVAEDPRSAEIIKPFLAGRDIKRYQSPKADKYLILLEKGVTNSKKSDMLPQVWLEKTYPAVWSFLQTHEEKAKARQDQGDYWWELRACDYYGEFEKAKIVLPDIAIRCEAFFDNQNFYCANTGYIIVSDDLSLLTILNSSLLLFFYSSITSSIRGGYLRFIKQYLEQLPICIPDDATKNALIGLHDQILSLKSADPAADTTALEAEIDVLVYGLYGLDESEQLIVKS